MCLFKARIIRRHKPFDLGDMYDTGDLHVLLYFRTIEFLLSQDDPLGQ